MNFRLEVLTPVNIGSGEALSQFSDYIYDKGNVYFIDHDALVRELSQRPNGQRIIDEFVKVVQSQAKGNARDRLKLKGFLEKAGLDYKKYAFKKLPASEEIREQIQLHVKSAGQPYIPGSSLKGAIRTALLAHLISPGEDRKIMEYIATEKQKSKGFRYIGQNFFGKFGDDVFKYIHVSDTLPFEQENLRVVKFYKYHLKNQKVDIPIVKEVIAKGSVSTFNIKMSAEDLKMVNQKNLNPKLSFFFEGNEGALLETINEYTRKNIEMELEQLRGFKSEITQEIEQFYQSLLDSLAEADKNKEAYLRIGSGKTYYDNTIAQKLSLDTVKQIVTRNFKKANRNIFPITRTIVIDGARKEVPGWVKISKL